MCVCVLEGLSDQLCIPLLRGFSYIPNVVGHCVFRPLEWAWDLPQREPC